MYWPKPRKSLSYKSPNLLFSCLILSLSKVNLQKLVCLTLPALKDSISLSHPCPRLHLYSSSHELVCSRGPPQWCQQILHCLWTGLAVHGLCLQGDGVRGGGPEGVGWWEQGLRLQHGSARLQQRVLRQHLPHLPHSPVGPAAHLRHLPIADGCWTRQVSGEEGHAVHCLTQGQPSLCQSWEEAWGAVVDIFGR